MQGHAASQGPMDPGGIRSSSMDNLLGPGGMPLGLGMAQGGALAGMSPAMVARALDKPAPALPVDGKLVIVFALIPLGNYPSTFRQTSATTCTVSHAGSCK